MRVVPSYVDVADVQESESDLVVQTYADKVESDADKVTDLNASNGGSHDLNPADVTATGAHASSTAPEPQKAVEPAHPQMGEASADALAAPVPNPLSSYHTLSSGAHASSAAAAAAAPAADIINATAPAAPIPSEPQKAIIEPAHPQVGEASVDALAVPAPNPLSSYHTLSSGAHTSSAAAAAAADAGATKAPESLTHVAGVHLAMTGAHGSAEDRQSNVLDHLKQDDDDIKDDDSCLHQTRITQTHQSQQNPAKDHPKTEDGECDDGDPDIYLPNPLPHGKNLEEKELLLMCASLLNFFFNLMFCVCLCMCVWCVLCIVICAKLLLHQIQNFRCHLVQWRQTYTQSGIRQVVNRPMKVVIRQRLRLRRRRQQLRSKPISSPMFHKVTILYHPTITLLLRQSIRIHATLLLQLLTILACLWLMLCVWVILCLLVL
jgi:hypothetical protein